MGSAISAQNSVARTTVADNGANNENATPPARGQL